jgi:hypothetical protein
MSWFLKKRFFTWAPDQKNGTDFFALDHADLFQPHASPASDAFWAGYDEQIVSARVMAQQAEVPAVNTTYEPPAHLPLIWQIQAPLPAEAGQYTPPAHLSLIWQIQGPDAPQTDLESDLAILEMRALNAALDAEAGTDVLPEFDECPNPALLRGNDAIQKAGIMDDQVMICRDYPSDGISADVTTVSVDPRFDLFLI